MAIKPGRPPADVGRITPPKRTYGSDLVYFSFKLLDIYTNHKFVLKHCGDGYLEKLLLRLQEVNRLTVREFRVYRGEEWRNHQIEFSATSEPEGFRQLPEQLRSNEAWQFQLTKEQHGRIHGIMIDNVFYVVWIDPCHNLYARQTCGH